jgi:cell division protein ZapE
LTSFEQVTDIADAMILQRLFSALFDSGCVVVATSNRPPDDLYYGGLNRPLFLPFIPVLKANCTVHHIVEPTDFRMLHAANHALFHTPLDDRTRSEMSRIFETLLGKSDNGRTLQARSETVTVMSGRQIAIRQAHSDGAGGIGCAKFTFEELCDQPFGASDYLAIAQQYGAIMIENIPKFSADLTNRNQMRRFITLLDVLYDANVRLVCSAAAEPHNLFETTTSGAAKPEGPQREDEAFAFQRCVSRLIEMQSAEYLERYEKRKALKGGRSH